MVSLVPMAMKLVLDYSTGSPFCKPGVKGTCGALRSVGVIGVGPMAVKLFLTNSTGLPFYKPGVKGSCGAPSHL